ncbi:MAG: ATP-binding cassette domain-containing protein, partial [Candidatus Moranbacteria bacterium]|nr:ATP-binding cassette domain-containing protein [Candidatus Moranbacteria bacterium]
MKKESIKKQDIEENTLCVIGARENNLKNITVSIPKSTITVITGPSGSGKSSLAFDVIHTEGQRRFLGGVSSFARSVLDIGSKPDVDRIEGISPTIAIDQRSVMGSPRSTVGTLSEMYDYLRAIFVGGGSVHCPQCKKELQKKSIQEMVKEIIKECLHQEIYISAFAKKNEKETRVFQSEQWDRWERLGVKKFFIKNRVISFSEISFSDWSDGESLEFLLDQFFLKKESLDNERLAQSLEKAFLEGDG